MSTQNAMHGKVIAETYLIVRVGRTPQGDITEQVTVYADGAQERSIEFDPWNRPLEVRPL